MGAGVLAEATTTVVYSMAPCSSRVATVLAIVDPFWPTAT